MLIMSTHLGFLAMRQGRLVQIGYAESPGAAFITYEPGSGTGLIENGPLAGFERVDRDGGFALRKDGLFLCAEAGHEELRHNRADARAWETFYAVSRAQAANIAGCFRSPEAEVARLAARVGELAAQGQPIRIQLGCGTNPREGFLNFDTNSLVPLFAVQHPEAYFLFPYADRPWGIPDNCVDFVFHEDFIEHISQLQQIQVLAEALRVLKPGAYHRINTPDLIAAMRRHSDFRQGFAGVYTGEAQWGHIALFSHMSLKEIAELVGYRAVVFTTQSCSVSPHAVPDIRPWAGDRDPITGNIYADLQK